MLDIQDPAYQDFRTDASCQIRPQSLIGEKFVECTPTQARAADTEPPPALRQIERGEGEGQYLLPVENTREVGRPRPDQQHHAPALPAAAVADRHRARHRPRRPRQGAQPGHPPRRPGAQGGRQGPRSSWPRRTRCSPTSRATPTPTLAPLAREREHVSGFIEQLEQGRRGDRRAPRRPRGRHRAAAALPAGAAPDDAPHRRAVRRDDARCSPTSATSRPTSTAADPELGPFSEAGIPAVESLGEAGEDRHRRRCATRCRSPRTCGASRRSRRRSARPRQRCSSPSRRAAAIERAARLRLLPGGRHQRLRLVRPLPARAPDPQHLLALLHGAGRRLLEPLRLRERRVVERHRRVGRRHRPDPPPHHRRAPGQGPRLRSRRCRR